MKKIINIKILTLIFLLVFLPLFVGCWGTTPGPGYTPQPPTITSTPITVATVDVLYNYNVVATDPNEEDTLTYTLTTSPTGMTIDSATGVISWTPNSGQIGDNNVTVEVSDGGLLDTQSFVITVNSVVISNLKLTPDLKTYYILFIKLHPNCSIVLPALVALFPMQL